MPDIVQQRRGNASRIVAILFRKPRRLKSNYTNIV